MIGPSFNCENGILNALSAVPTVKVAIRMRNVEKYEPVLMENCLSIFVFFSDIS